MIEPVYAVIVLHVLFVKHQPGEICLLLPFKHKLVSLCGAFSREPHCSCFWLFMSILTHRFFLTKADESG